MSNDIDAIRTRAEASAMVLAQLTSNEGTVSRSAADVPTLLAALDAVTAERDAMRNAYSDSERYRQEDRDELEWLRTENELLRAGEAQAIGESEVE